MARAALRRKSCWDMGDCALMFGGDFFFSYRPRDEESLPPGKQGTGVAWRGGCAGVVADGQAVKFYN